MIYFIYEIKKKKKLTQFGNFIYHRFLDLPTFSAHEEDDLAANLNIRPLVQALQRNEILIMTVDGVRASNFIEVKILGQIIPFATGSISMAGGTGAVVLPTFVVDSNTRAIGIKLIIEKPLELEHTDNPKQDLRVNIERFARIFESYIDRYPHLYRWGNNYFEKRRWASRIDVADRYPETLEAKKRKREKCKVIEKTWVKDGTQFGATS